MKSYQPQLVFPSNLQTLVSYAKKKKNLKLKIGFKAITEKLFNKPVFAAFALDKSSHSEVFCKKCVLKNFVKFTGKHLCENTLLKKDSETGGFL